MSWIQPIGDIDPLSHYIDINGLRSDEAQAITMQNLVDLATLAQDYDIGLPGSSNVNIKMPRDLVLSINLSENAFEDLLNMIQSIGLDHHLVA